MNFELMRLVESTLGRGGSRLSSALSYNSALGVYDSLIPVGSLSPRWRVTNTNAHAGWRNIKEASAEECSVSGIRSSFLNLFSTINQPLLLPTLHRRGNTASGLAGKGAGGLRFFYIKIMSSASMCLAEGPMLGYAGMQMRQRRPLLGSYRFRLLRAREPTYSSLLASGRAICRHTRGPRYRFGGCEARRAWRRGAFLWRLS